MKKLFVLFVILTSTTTLFRFFNQKSDCLQSAYLYHTTQGDWDKSYYWGKLCYNPIKKKAWVDGGFGINYYDNKFIANLLKEGIQENVAEQKEYFNWNLNRINKPWRKKNPSFVPYEITPDDYEIKLIKPGDPEFFNSLRYALIKNSGLVEIDEESALINFKTWFHSVYYFFVSPPPNKTDTYYSTVYPHHKISVKEWSITLEFYD